MKLIRNILVLVIIGISSICYANDKPPSHITSLQVVEKGYSHYFKYSHFKIIGICVWWHCHGIFHCGFSTTMELDQYIPDLLVSVYNANSDNPWWEGNTFYDRVSYFGGNNAMKAATGHNLGYGDTSMQQSGSDRINGLRTKAVDVVGSPMLLFHLPFISLRKDPSAYVPYYLSDLDTVSDRLDFAEAIRPETYNIFGNYIGKNFVDHWGYEFPRAMTVDNANDYKASIMAALHAADLVTNRNDLHVTKSVSDSCGKNCAVSNVIEESKDGHEIWEEVYPNDKHIQLGEDDSLSPSELGSDDDQKGHGNYVFMIWRHYRGCIQHDGHLVWKSKSVPDTHKR